MRDLYLDAEKLTRRTFAALVAALPVSLRGDCTRTSRAVQGPYYRADAPVTTDLRRGNSAPIIVHGVVRGIDCKPLASALIEVWQADEHGKYDVDYGMEGTFLRAQMRTNAKGEYSFSTIRPAAYGVARFMRPAHIHFIVSASSHRRLVTQLYFAGDPYLDRDPLRAVHPDLIVTAVDGRCRFDISLA
jgi:protocatechuate 3,4-dioxygenase beta subunit